MSRMAMYNDDCQIGDDGDSLTVMSKDSDRMIFS